MAEAIVADEEIHARAAGGEEEGTVVQDDGTGLMAVGPLMSSVRLRQSGFVEMLSSEKSMEWWLAELQLTSVLPPR